MAVIDNILEQLRKHGERLTIQRRAVIEALIAAGTHLTIADIQRYTETRGVGFDTSTVYRILEKLVDLGLVGRTDVGASGVVYELIVNDPHHHLICLGCGSIIRIPDTTFDQLRQQVLTQFEFQPRLDHIAIFGYCHACQEQLASNSVR